MSEITGRLGRYLVQCVTIDSRTLAVFRIAIGLLIIGDILARASTFTLFYTENGVVPQELAEQRTADGAFSLFYFTQDSTVIALLFLIHALVAIQLMIGYKTRLAIILSFLFVISLDHHNPLVLSHADTLFRLLCFWAIFIPLGERWSIDAIHRDREPRTAVFSLGTAAILLQMVYMYAANGTHKLDDPLWRSRDATPLIFGLDDMTYFLAGPMRQFPALLEFLGTMWFLLLIMSPLLLLLHGRPRYVLASLIFCAHLSFTLTVRIGAFGWVGMSGVMLFFQSIFWDDLATLSKRLNLSNRVVIPIHNGISTFGNRLATRLPGVGSGPGLPPGVRGGAYDVGLTLLIMSLFVFPAISFASYKDLIEWDRSSVEQRIESEFRKIGLEQSRWAVFAPSPRTVDRYYVFPALTTNGELLDVYNDRPFSFERPYDELQNIYGNYRQRFYMDIIRRSGDAGSPPEYLADWICGDYAKRGIELTQINMYVVSERVTRETIDDHSSRERWSSLMSTHACSGHAPEEIELPEDPPERSPQ